MATCLSDEWAWPPAALAPCPEEIHVWRTELEQPAARLEQCFAVLNPAEQARSRRFHFRRDQEHFTAARGMLRILLGRYLDVPPQQLDFCTNAFGKPSLAAPFAAGDLRFNVSHSHGLALIAVAAGREVGVDVEWMRADLVSEEMIAQSFSKAEAEAIRALAPEWKVQAFFNCWTRKEAFIKAVGEGLSYPLDQFSVSLTPGEPARLLSARGGAQEVARWLLSELLCDAGYAAALAVEGPGWSLRRYTL
jgi:4'-phosphopantetheinyl transferase